MDYLIEMLVNAIVAAFRDRAPKAMKLPAPIPRQQSPAANRTMARPPQRRPIAQATLRRSPKVVRPAQASPKPVSPPRPVAAKPVPKPIAPAQPAAAPLTGAAIGQLLRSRPATVRSVFVLTEILQPPLALRERSAIM